MESIISFKIFNHSNKFNIGLINTEQHSFKDKHSTSTNFLKLLNDLTSHVDLRDTVDIITVDFANAFKSINHNKLLIKLRLYGIVGKTLSWIKEF